MSRQLDIIPTTFMDGEMDQKFGVRICDGITATFTDTWDELPGEDMNVLRMVLEDEEPGINEMLHMAIENESNVYIGDNFYKWEEVKNIFEEIMAI